MYLSRSSYAFFFVLLTFIGVLIYFALGFYTFHKALYAIKKSKKSQFDMKRYPKLAMSIENTENDNISTRKYVLLWTTAEFYFEFTDDGDKLLFSNDCSNKNCYLTTNKSLLGEVRKFDAIVFSISVLKGWKRNMPKQRDSKQKYIFYATLPANEYPVCNIHADDFFNWTWTYKLNSDICTPLIEVRDLNGRFIAPKPNVKWLDDTSITSSEPPNKRKSVVWHNKNCTNEHANPYVKELGRNLKEHGMELEVYGCDQKCPEDACGKIIEDVYFYLAFETSVSKDYVTKEVLEAYKHGAVPVVRGGADYSKFLPPGSYIDARFDTPERLASLLGYITRNPLKYNKYFNWKIHYIIQEANLQKGYCKLCSLLNNEIKSQHSSYKNVRKWWYQGNLYEKCYPKGAETFDEVLSYISNPAIRKNYMP